MGTLGGGEAVMTELRLRLVPDPALLAPTRRQVRRWAEENRIAEERSERLLLAVGEALANSMEHALAAARVTRPAELRDQDEPSITLDLRLDDRGRIVARVCDPGPWREPGSRPAGLRGRGLALMRRAMGRVEVVRRPDDGTVVTLVEDRPPAGTPGRPGASGGDGVNAQRQHRR